MLLVEPGLEDFPCGSGDAMMPYGWSAMTLSKNLCCFISDHASSYDPVSTLFEQERLVPKVMPQIAKEFLFLLASRSEGYYSAG
ncbi:hypothetical protein Tco_0241270 [Tanacetum coccineum]